MDFNLHKMSQEQISMVSTEAKNLICSMLTKSPEKRIRIQEVMANPWISVGINFELFQFG